jgi:hypothetical protein
VLTTSLSGKTGKNDTPKAQGQIVRFFGLFGSGNDQDPFASTSPVLRRPRSETDRENRVFDAFGTHRPPDPAVKRSASPWPKSTAAHQNIGHLALLGRPFDDLSALGKTTEQNDIGQPTWSEGRFLGDPHAGDGRLRLITWQIPARLFTPSKTVRDFEVHENIDENGHTLLKHARDVGFQQVI